MELVSIYLYNRIPIQSEDISNRSFHNLKRNGWYNDVRTNRKFTMLNKRIEVNQKWYRALIRFEYNGVVEGVEAFILSMPCPFIITECEPMESTTSARWKDNKTYHGPNLGSVSEFLRKGVPIQVIDEVYSDLKEFMIYN
jgi:hypothetical protein